MFSARTGSSYQNGRIPLDLVGDADGVHGREPAVHLDEDVHVGADGIADGAHVLHSGVLDFLADVGAPASGDGVELEGGEACFDDL